jgi:hypothetical protein
MFPTRYFINRETSPLTVHKRVAVLNAVLLICGFGVSKTPPLSYANFRFVICAVFIKKRAFF